MRETNDASIGNEGIEQAIEICGMRGNETDAAVLNAVRECMRENGKVLVPMEKDESEEGRNFILALRTKDGRHWQVMFTSEAESEKGEKSEVCAYPIEAVLKAVMVTDAAGLVINPWGRAFFLSKDTIQGILEAEGIMDFSVLEERSGEEAEVLKKAGIICNRVHTERNHLRLMKLLRDAEVCVPCTAVMSEEDDAMIRKMLELASQNGDLNDLKGTKFKTKGETRMIPDILQNGEDFFFPVFTSEHEMGEYGSGFSTVFMPFLQAAVLAENNEKGVKGIVMNAFTDPFVIPMEICRRIRDMDSGHK